VVDGESYSGKWFGMRRANLVALLRSLANDLESIDAIATSTEPSVEMDAWRLGSRQVPCLTGQTQGHASIVDGRTVASSQIFYFDPVEGIARTLSRWYRLGSRADRECWSSSKPPT